MENDRIYREMRLQYTYEPSFEFEDPREHDYWGEYKRLLRTIIGVSCALTEDDPENQWFIDEDGDTVFTRLENVYQCYVKLPFEITVVEDDDTQEMDYGELGE